MKLSARWRCQYRFQPPILQPGEVCVLCPYEICEVPLHLPMEHSVGRNKLLPSLFMTAGSIK